MLIRLLPGTSTDAAHFGEPLRPQPVRYEEALRDCERPSDPALSNAWLDFLGPTAQVSRLGDHCFAVQLSLDAEHYFRAHARGWGQSLQRLPAKVEQRAVFDLKLVPTVHLTGILLDEDRRPVRDAALSIREPRRSDVRGETDSAGAFHFEVYPGDVHVTATHPEHLPVTECIRAPASDVRLRMEPAGHLEIRPLDDRGRPVAARPFLTQVACGERLGPTDFRDSPRMWRSLRALSEQQRRWSPTRDIRLRSGPLPPGCYAVLVEAQGFAPKVFHAHLEGRGVPMLEVRLRRGMSISGRVVDDAGQPVARANVHAWANLHDSQSAYTDARGRFTVRGLTRADYRLEASYPSAERSPVTMASAGTSAVELKIRRWPKLRVQVLDATGQLLRRFRLNGMDFSIPEDRSELAMDWPWEGQRLLRFEAEGASAQREALFEPGRERDLGVVVLAPRTDLAVRLVAANGAPATGCQSSLGAREAASEDMPTVDGPSFAGLLQARGLDSAPTRVVVVCREGYFDGVINPLLLQEQLPLRPGARLEVRLPSEVTWAYRPVTLLSQERKFSVVQRASQDGVEFQGLPPGRYSLDARQPAREVRATVEVRDGESLVDLR